MTIPPPLSHICKQMPIVVSILTCILTRIEFQIVQGNEAAVILVPSYFLRSIGGGHVWLHEDA